MFGRAAMFGRVQSEVLISRTIGTAFTNMNDGGSVSIAYDGNLSHTWHNAVRRNNSGPGYVGKAYPSAMIFGKAVLYPSSDNGFAGSTTTLRIYGKNGSNPANATDGTILAEMTGVPNSITTPVTLFTLDDANTYDRIWAYSSGNNASFSELELYQLVGP